MNTSTFINNNCISFPLKKTHLLTCLGKTHTWTATTGKSLPFLIPSTHSAANPIFSVPY